MTIKSALQELNNAVLDLQTSDYNTSLVSQQSYRGPL